MPGVHLSGMGQGQLGGTERQVLVTWTSGSLVVLREHGAPPVTVLAGGGTLAVGERLELATDGERVLAAGLGGRLDCRGETRGLDPVRRVSCP